MKVKMTKDRRNKASPWILRCCDGPDPVTGKNKWCQKSFKYKKDAEDFKTDLKVGISDSTCQDNHTMINLKEFCTDYSQSMKARLRPSSIYLYQQTIERLVKYFGAYRPLQDIKPRTADTFIAELERIDGKEGELSNWSKSRVLRNCRTIFETAVDWELIQKNPYKKVKAPQCTVLPWYYLKPSDYRKLLGIAPELRWKAFYALGYTAGLRFGELFNLIWNDVDFERGEVRVANRRGTTSMPEFFVKDYETRKLRLPNHTLEVLADLKASREIMDEDTPYVLLDEQRYKVVLKKWKKYRAIKRPWRNQDMANNTLRDLRKHVERTGIKPDAQLNIHTLRKSCIQNWANELPINVTKELAGHSSITTTQKFYLQVDEYHRAKAAQIVENLVSGTGVQG
jgi:integrase